jgi:RHS repeat-associated protein
MASEAPTISVPNGGGALASIGETFQPDPFSGTAAFTLPIVTSPGRAGFGPGLALQYSSGHGNGPFGLGWQMGLPSIARKTERGLPRYDDRDVFVLSGSEDLVPVVAATGRVESVPRDGFSVTRYRPRTEGPFARIERWTKGDDDHWRVTSRENVTSIYGRTTGARLTDPHARHRVFAWLIEETFDAAGNHILYEYAADAPDLVVPEPFETNRTYCQRYLRRLYYGNVLAALTYASGDPVGPRRMGTDHDDQMSQVARRYAFEVLFDYGDLPALPADPYVPPPAGSELFVAATASAAEGKRPCAVRPDPFSTFRPGFELRTLRRCRRILMMHHFRELDGPTLVKSTELTYGEDAHAGFSRLVAISLYGYRRDGASYRYAAAPPIELRYSAFEPDKQRYRSVTAEGGELPWRSLSDRDVSVIDVFGDGLPDVVHTTRSGFRFWRNLGEGRLDRPRGMPVQPSGVTLSQPGVAIADQGGDGMADLLDHQGSVKGFYEMTPDGGWATFRHYHDFPSVSLSDPNARLVDLTGDGRADLLVTTQDHFVWHESRGEEGYTGSRHVERVHDLDAFPDVFFSDPSSRVRLADMTGDGLDDIVLVHSGRIDYWPNVGYGRFGRRVTMAAAPRFDAGFDPRRVMLVDLDGTGCADLMYVDYGAVHFWFNCSGNAWSERHTIHGTPLAPDVEAVRFVDLFGTGTATLVWTADFAFQPGGNYKALDICGGVKPHLLIEMANNLGVTTRVQYAPSTKFQIADRAAGRPWATALPFPVHVVEKVETIDHISGTKLVVSYAYHHGYYDGREREFRGFGMVERFDSEKIEDFTRAGLGGDPDAFANRDPVFHAPTVRTRTWFHTGAYFDAGVLRDRYRDEFWAGDPQAFTLEDHDVPAHPSAYRALRGALLRQEIYALDGPPLEDVPFSVTEHRYRVSELQAASASGPAVYHQTPYESLSSHYERNPADPRVGHEITLGVDRFGNVTDQIQVGYPRRVVPADVPEQGVLEALYTKTDFINHTTDPAFHVAGLVCQSRTFELTGLQPPPGRSFRPSDFLVVSGDLANPLAAGSIVDFDREPPPASPAKRIVEWRRTYFRTDASAADVDRSRTRTGRLPLGQAERLALPYEELVAAFSDGLIAQTYAPPGGGGPRVDAALLAAAGYVREADVPGYWWMPSDRRAFDRQRYLRIIESCDPAGHVTTFEYDDYLLLLRRSSDPFGFATRAVNDYRTLRPSEVVSVNDVTTTVAFDMLGQVVGTAVASSSGAGDTLAGFRPDLSESEIAAFVADPQGEAAALLGGASSRVVYDLWAYARVMADGRPARQPAFTATLAREIHASDAAASPIQILFTYTDGFGRTVQTKTQAEAGAVPQRDAAGRIVVSGRQPVAGSAPAARRWVASGWRVLDNKARPVREFEPFFTDSHRFEKAVQVGFEAMSCYDTLGRPSCTLHPNHTYSKIVRSAWMQTHWDVTDTVLQADPRQDPDVGAFFRRLSPNLQPPTWHEERKNGQRGAAEQFAADQAAAIARTPAETHLDVFERPVLRIDDAGPAGRLYTRTRFDIRANKLALIDPRGVTIGGAIDMAGRHLSVVNPDTGTAQALPDVRGRRFREWDAAGHETQCLYDALGRLTDVWVRRPASSAFDLVEKMIYGEERGTAAAAAHQLGKVWKVYDGAGLLENEEFDFKGNLARSIRRLVRDPSAQPVWGTASDPFGHRFDEPAARQLLDPVREYRAVERVDALNRTIASETPDGSVQERTYTPAGLLASVSVRLRGSTAAVTFVRDMDYDARGRRTRVEYGNGIVTDYEYAPDTLHLSHVRTTRVSGAAGSRTLQDVTYTYDPAGNVVAVRDDAHSQIFFNNQAIDPEMRFKYDPLFRLVEASGREHQAMSACHYTDGQRKESEFLTLPQPTSNAQALQKYTQRYKYDDSGNLIEIEHGVGGSIKWVRRQQAASGGNRLLSTGAGCPGESTTLSYDGNGNLAALPHVPRLTWNDRNRLLAADLNVAAQPDRAAMQYDAAGVRMRKTVRRQNGAIVEQRVYLGGYEIFLRADSAGIVERWDTLHVADGAARVALVETKIDPADPRYVLATLVRFQLTDRLGAAILEVDDSQAARPISYEEFTPFGETSYLAGESLAEVQRKRYRFTGKERDDETGLYYFGLRYLAPWMGRWIGPDPAGPADGPNLYAYARNNPLTLKDAGGAQSVPLTQIATVEEGLTYLETHEYGRRISREHAVARNQATGELWIWQGTGDQVRVPDGWDLIAHSHTSKLIPAPSDEDYTELARRGQRTHFFFAPDRGWQILEYDAGTGRFTRTVFDRQGRVFQGEMYFDPVGQEDYVGRRIHWLATEAFAEVGQHQGITPEHLGRMAQLLDEPWARSAGTRGALEMLTPEQLERVGRTNLRFNQTGRALFWLAVIAAVTDVAVTAKEELENPAPTRGAPTSKAVGKHLGGFACAGAAAGPSAELGGIAGGALVGALGGGPIGAAIGAVVGGFVGGATGSAGMYFVCSEAAAAGIDVGREKLDASLKEMQQ